MDTYELTRTFIALFPILLLVGGFWFFRNSKRLIRTLILCLVGWVAFLGSVVYFWRYSIDFAPTQEIAIELTYKDGGSKAFALLFGWFYSLLILMALELIRKIWRESTKLFARSSSSDGDRTS